MIPHILLRRMLFAVVMLPVLVAGVAISRASAATTLYVVANEAAEIWQIDPTTAVQIASFPLNPKNAATRPGLAFDGSEIFYTDETLAYVQVYSPTGTPVRTLPKPAGNEPGSGLGVSTTTLFLVGLDSRITPVDKATGVAGASFVIPGAEHGLTFAGSRNSLFVTVNDSTTIKELSTTGAVLNTITVPAVFRGLGFSSSAKVLFGTRAGFLYAVDPDTGAGLAGYPVDIKNMNLQRPNKTGALASDEPVLESCGDGTVNPPAESCDPPSSVQSNGQTCRQDCTYCGDGELDTPEQCDDGNTNDTDNCRNDCTLPRCGDGIKDPNEGCDDGNNLNGDGCDANCVVEPFCGDGIIDPQLGEQCDPPNVPGCDANCHATEICTDLVDDDGDGRIDCLDDDCDCLPIGRDPGAIRFGKTGQKDLFSVHGSLDPASSFSLGTEDIKFLLSNANGKVLTIIIPAGDVKKIGKNLFRFKDRVAQQQRDGLARFDLRYYPKKDIFTFLVKKYDDLSLATLADMSLQLVIGTDAFLNQSTWQKTPKGWVLTLPGE